MKLRSYLAKYARHLTLVLFVILFLPACIVVVEKDDPYDDDDYYRRRWQLEFFIYSNTTFEPADGSVYTVSFSNDTLLSGRADCLDFEGQYTVGRTSTLSIDNLSSAGGSCDGNSVAPVFLQELANARSFTGSTDELVIHLEGTNNLMRFRPY